MIAHSLAKLTTSTLGISRAIENCPNIQDAQAQGVNMLSDIGEYVSALTVYFMAADGEASEEELTLVKQNLAAMECLQIGFPESNHVEWAQQVLSKPPFFFQMALFHDRNNHEHVTSIILWHLRHIVCTIIEVDGKHTEAELSEAKLFFEMLHELIESEGVAWSYGLMDSPIEITQRITPLAESGGWPKKDGKFVKERLPETDDKLESLDVCLEELDSLIGLDGVKQEVRTLVNLMKVRSMREARGLKMPELSLHMVFSGNPGTGKTTVARLLARIYKALGVLPGGQVVEVDRSGLVAGYVGQTAIKTKEALEKAHGGILFIDEAYSLLGPGNDFGQEAIDTILKYMEDNRGEIVVIAAGYTNEMQSFVRSNPGLQSRFNKFINFGDYSIDELYSILVQLVESHQYFFNEHVAALIHSSITNTKASAPENFANARVVRNMFESIIQEQANRIADLDHSDESIIHEIVESDVRNMLRRSFCEG